MKRVSHDLLMDAQKKLGEARDAETQAGHRGVAMILNDLALSLFRIALDDEIDEWADAAYDVRFPGGAL